MALSFDSLTKSIDVLGRSLIVAQKQTPGLDADLQETIRSGVIQHFEVAYEQCWKMIQRWLKENQSIEEAEYPRTRKELFRLAARYGLITDPLPWFVYGDARNLTAHTYDEKKANFVYETAKNFLQDAQYLAQQLEGSND